MKDRRPIDNILIANETPHMMNQRHTKRKWCALKLDISKAYDKLSWDFIQSRMNAFGFHLPFVDRIMKCITSVRYRVVFNGHPTDLIHPHCGIRQGDPISVYIYILCGQALTIDVQSYDIQRLHSFLLWLPKEIELTSCNMLMMSFYSSRHQLLPLLN